MNPSQANLLIAPFFFCRAMAGSRPPVPKATGPQWLRNAGVRLDEFARQAVLAPLPSPPPAPAGSAGVEGDAISPPATCRSRRWVELPGGVGQVDSISSSSAYAGSQACDPLKLCSAATCRLCSRPSLRGTQVKNNIFLFLAVMAHPSPSPKTTQKRHYSAKHKDT